MVSSPFVYDISEVVFCYWFMSYMKLLWSKGELGSLCQDDIDRTVVLLSAYQWECMEQWLGCNGCLNLNTKNCEILPGVFHLGLLMQRALGRPWVLLAALGLQWCEPCSCLRKRRDTCSCFGVAPPSQPWCKPPNSPWSDNLQRSPHCLPSPGLSPAGSCPSDKGTWAKSWYPAFSTRTDSAKNQLIERYTSAIGELSFISPLPGTVV